MQLYQLCLKSIFLRGNWYFQKVRCARLKVWCWRPVLWRLNDNFVSFYVLLFDEKHVFIMCIVNLCRKELEGAGRANLFADRPVGLKLHGTGSSSTWTFHKSIKLCIMSWNVFECCIICFMQYIMNVKMSNWKSKGARLEFLVLFLWWRRTPFFSG